MAAILTCQNPLNWPPHQRRTESPKSSRFGEFPILTLLNHIERELQMLGGHSIVVTADLDVGRSGRFLSRFNSCDDPAVAVFWTGADGTRRCLAIDQYDCAADNLRAVGKSLEAIRALARWGGDAMTNAALDGVAALPGCGESNIVGWFSGCVTREAIETRYRELAMEHHPDRGGRPGIMAEINESKAQAMQAVEI